MEQDSDIIKQNDDFSYKFTEDTKKYLEENKGLKDSLREFNENKKFSEDLSGKINEIGNSRIKIEILSYTAFKVLEKCFTTKNDSSIEINKEEIEKNQNELIKILKCTKNKNDEDTTTNNIINDITNDITNFFKDDKETKSNPSKEEIEDIFKEILLNQIEGSIDLIRTTATIGGKGNNTNQNVVPIGGKSNNTDENVVPIGNSHKEKTDEEKENQEESSQKKGKKTKKSEDKDEKKKEENTISESKISMDTEKESKKINEAVKRISDLTMGCIYFALGTICPIFYLFSCFHLLNATLGPEEMEKYLNNENPIIKCLTRISATPELFFTSTKRLFQEGKSKEGMEILRSLYTGDKIKYSHNEGLTEKIAKEILDKIVENSKNKNEKESGNGFDKNDLMGSLLSGNTPQENNVSQKNNINEELNDLKERVNNGDISDEDIDKLNNLCEKHGEELTEKQTKEFNECLTANNELDNSLQDMQSSNIISSLSGSNISEVDGSNISPNSGKNFQKDEINKKSNLDTENSMPISQY